jgi:hypothetical protein
MINYWKVILWEKFQMRPKDKICIGTSAVCPYYLSLMLASFELGLVLVVGSSVKSNINPYTTRQSLYADLKLCIYDDANSNENSLSVNKLFFKTLSHINIFDTYQIQDHSLYNKLKDECFAQNSDVALHTTSSGTTGVPTVVEKTHEFLIKSSQRQVKAWNIKSTDNIMHTRQIAHGAVFDLFWLPTLMACPIHHVYVVDDDSIDDVRHWLSIVKNKQINQIFLPTMKSFDLFVNHSPVFDHNITIIAGITAKRESLALIKEKHIKCVLTSYGATELGNAVFINTCTPENVDNFVSNRYFMPDDTFEIIRTTPYGTTFVNHFDNDLTITLKDRWVQVDAKYWDFLGRTVDYKINVVYVKTDSIDNIIKNYIDQEYTLVFDEEYQSIYLAIYEDFDLNSIQLINVDIATNISTDIKIDKVSKLSKADFIQSFKPDSFSLRGYFRNAHT